ncbi:MAG: radical SAM protein [Nitrospiraceae bacterium]|nr:radical SAM protein [Nitrospiraceae bacterium]
MYSPFRHAGSIIAKTRPIHLTFFLTRRCNAKCPFCFYLKSDDAPLQGGEELSDGEIERISRSFGTLLWLAFSGGEIFLRDDLVEVAGTFYRNNRPAIMLFPTNGLLPEVIREKTEEILRESTRSTVAVKLSLDGLHDRHDEVRRTPGSYEKTMRTYKLLSGLADRYPNFELGINTVFCSENQDEMDNIIDFVKGLGQVRTHTISLVRGNLAEEGFKRVDRRKYRAAIERLECSLKDRTGATYRFRGAKVKAAQDILQRRLIDRTEEKQRRLIPCYAGKINLVLRENGDVYPCEILTSKMGNIRDSGYDINKVLETAEAGKILRSIGDGECYCTHECNFITNILFNPRLYPGLLKEYLQL